MVRFALRRKPLRRYTIYDAFVGSFVEGAVRKAARGGGLARSPDELRSLVLEYCRRLGLKMTEEATPKVVYRPSAATELFGDDDDWAQFFGNGDALLAAVRAAAPLSYKSGVYSFQHKSLQEFSTAHAVVAAATDAVRATGMALERLAAVAAAPMAYNATP